MTENQKYDISQHIIFWGKSIFGSCVMIVQFSVLKK